MSITADPSYSTTTFRKDNRSFLADHILFIYNIKLIQTAKTKQGLRMVCVGFSCWPADRTWTLGSTWQFKNIAVFLGIDAWNSLKLV